ncbi:hypothetical protein [Amycolatopsis echigonensis]|uniref:Uncharacterized protein n=1 Tax=Amycolatopsis echigonensis TaxID=2576905 RepID=A0A8E1W9Q3_9PSEU|nr:hypothetical protein [Amycolatopsis echigonensis]MBB2506000.1 hypothetical protein [Amycolatopsis echigonensis]
MRRAASALLVITLAVLVYVAPAALVEQTGPAHQFRVTGDGTLLAVAGGLIVLAYSAFLLAWHAYRARDEVDRALAADDELGAALRAWRAEVESVPIP